MTAQIPEEIRYQGEQLSLCTQPLDEYLALTRKTLRPEVICSALWRGYVGTWEVVNDRLYLVALNGTLEGGEDLSLETLFPGFPDRVFAHWYTGTLRLVRGEQVRYVHMGYGSTYAHEVFLVVQRGVVVERREQRHEATK